MHLNPVHSSIKYNADEVWLKLQVKPRMKNGKLVVQCTWYWVFISLIKHTVCIFNSMLAWDSIYTEWNALYGKRFKRCPIFFGFNEFSNYHHPQEESFSAREFRHKKCTISHFYHSCLMLNDAGNFSVCFCFILFFYFLFFPHSHHRNIHLLYFL